MSATNPQRAVMTWQLPATDGFDGGVGQLILDVAINENHGVQAEVTTHQVEVGSDITDHIRPMPQRFSIEGMISNTPLGGTTSYMDGVSGSVKAVSRVVAGSTVSYSAFSWDSGFERVRVVFGDLANAIQSAALFNLTTTLATYDSMACINISVPRNAQLGNVLRFSADFQMIRFVSTETVAALPGRPKKHRGAKTGKEATDQQKDKVKRSFFKAVGVSRALGVGN
jgi:hypothetical protein